MYAEIVKWFECCAPEPEPGVRLLTGTAKFVSYILFSLFFSKLDIVKVINCFFFLKPLTFQKISNHVFKNISLLQYCIMR